MSTPASLRASPLLRVNTCPASVYTALFANSALNLNDAAAVVNPLACVNNLTILNVC